MMTRATNGDSEIVAEVTHPPVAAVAASRDTTAIADDVLGPVKDGGPDPLHCHPQEREASSFFPSWPAKSLGASWGIMVRTGFITHL